MRNLPSFFFLHSFRLFRMCIITLDYFHDVQCAIIVHVCIVKNHFQFVFLGKVFVEIFLVLLLLISHFQFFVAILNNENRAWNTHCIWRQTNVFGKLHCMLIYFLKRYIMTFHDHVKKLSLLREFIRISIFPYQSNVWCLLSFFLTRDVFVKAIYIWTVWFVCRFFLKLPYLV